MTEHSGPPRKRRPAPSKAKIVHAAGQLSTSTLLDSSDRLLAQKLNVSRTTLKRHFPTTGALVSAVVADLDLRKEQVDPELRARARRHEAASSRQGDLPTALVDRLREIRLLVGEDERIDATVQEVDKWLGTPNRLAIATLCSFAAYRFVICTQAHRPDAAEKARSYAEKGLTEIPPGHAHDMLRAQLYRIAAAAERRIAQAAGAELTEKSTDVDRLAAERVVLGRMAAIGRLKKEEAALLEGIGQPMWAAAARYHADRAIAIAEGRPELEVHATGELAVYLAEQIRDQVPPPAEILVPFLIRWCAAQVAYRELFPVSMDPETATSLRNDLLASLGRRTGYDTTARVLTTMFALAAAYSAGRADGHLVHPQDLTALVTYGTVGQLLVGAYLHHLAAGLANRSTGAENIVAPDVVAATKATGPVEQLLPMDVPDLAAAARSHYRAAIARSLVGGSSSVLVARARKGLEELVELPGGTVDLDPLPLLRAVEGTDESDVDVHVTQRLALTVLIHKQPTPQEARKLLNEFQPFIAMLKSIANHDVVVDLEDNPAESGRTEPIVVLGPTDDRWLQLGIG
ncbi:hypothetical protein OCS65_28095 (plasmid) [Rhodococcus aetherivorans]|uniref:Uncharacterized protein n=1 Tax=Rhodococcus aetherivorans TaxID=191292 RepID=A0AA46SGJ2_9NOCA|nr:hypothetical protein [Rhodococcus aetherivorans]UYF97174.1 hypothetical protein OCS65_28095 [Rhodococcus aetherivorans]